MIIVPELETIVILVPRAGSTSLREALLATYPYATLLYRYMEADGVPYGYEHWRKVGIVRPPMARLWSLYHYCRSLTYEHPHWSPGRAAQSRLSAQIPFAEWLENNEFVFAMAGPNSEGRLIARYTTLHPMPETQKSQYVYLRPDLGTEIWPFGAIDSLADSLGVKLKKTNGAPDKPMAPLSLPCPSRFDWDARAAGAFW